MSVSLNKFNCFSGDIATKVHNLGSDQLTVALTDSAPAATNTVQSNISEISYTNLSTRNITTTSLTDTTGITTLICAQLTLTASGTVPQFRYVAIYNSTASGKNLIGWYDFGSEVNMGNGDIFVVGFDQSNGVLTIQ